MLTMQRTTKDILTLQKITIRIMKVRLQDILKRTLQKPMLNCTQLTI